MSFIFHEEAQSYFHPVKIEQVTADGNRELAQFDGRFRNLDQPRIDEIMRAIVARGQAAEAGQAVDDGFSDQSVAAEVLDGWRDMLTPAGEPVPFTDETKARFLNHRGAAGAVVLAWFESITTKPEVREGN